MFTKTRIKLTVLLAALLIALYALLSMVAGAVVNTLTIGQVDRSLKAGAIGFLHHPNLLNVAINQSQTNVSPGDHFAPHLGHPLFLVDIRLKNGQIVTANDMGLAKSAPFVATMYDKMQFQTWFNPTTGDHLRLIMLPMQNQKGTTVDFLQLGVDISPQMQVLQKFWQVFVSVGLIGFVVALFVGYYVSGRALRPIKKSWISQQRFVADASHELRTPLAIIQANLDLALSHGDNADVEVLEWVSNAKAEARRLTRLTADLLTLARSDGHETVLELTEVDLPNLITEVVDLFTPLADDKKIQLRYEQDAKTGVQNDPVKADQARLRQLLIILIDNALKYTLEGGQITITLYAQRHHTALRVKDTGIGMDREEMTHAFDRFYRADQARKRESGGTGLGLSIAKWIVEMHGGKISVQSAKGEGSIFIIVF